MKKTDIKKSKCPECNSNNAETVNYIGISCIVCKNCGYDESRQYDVFPEQKTSQKAKGKYLIYKTGGHRRTINKKH